MAKAYYSAVLDRPAEDVWAVVRDFNGYPRYIEGVDQSAIEDEKSGDSVGAVRSFRYGGRWIRQRLVALSDADRSFTYAGFEPFRFPSEDGAMNPLAPINYEGTLRVTPVVDGDRAFVEWWLTFDCNSDERDRWNSFLVSAISHWVGSLERTVCARPRSHRE
jgi:polyketide cyclase/dehydrase/lipid transport protein